MLEGPQDATAGIENGAPTVREWDASHFALLVLGPPWKFRCNRSRISIMN